MATITINIPNGVAKRVLDAITSRYHYKETIKDPKSTEEIPLPDIPNPQTKAQFFKGVIVQFLKENVKAYESSKASEKARVSAIDKVDSEVNLT